MPSAPKGRNNSAQANGLGEKVHPDGSSSSPEGARYVTGASARPLKRVARGWYLALSGLSGKYGVFSDPGRWPGLHYFAPLGSILTATPCPAQKCGTRSAPRRGIRIKTAALSIGERRDRKAVGEGLFADYAFAARSVYWTLDFDGALGPRDLFEDCRI